MCTPDQGYEDCETDSNKLKKAVKEIFFEIEAYHDALDFNKRGKGVAPTKSTQR